MTRVDVRGAPRAQGVAQGTALASDIRASVDRVRRERGRIAWWRALAAARRGPGRAVARFLPQHHERICGIGLAAGVRLSFLQWLDSEERGPVGGFADGAALVAVVHEAQARVLRRTEPDAGGFASAEVTAPAWAGCLGGVNRAGLGVLVLEDAPRGEPSIRLLAQDLLLRAPRLDAALEHAHRRAPYLRQSGALLLVDSAGAPQRLELRAGKVRVAGAAPRPEPGARATLTIDAGARTLRYQPPEGAPFDVEA